MDEDRQGTDLIARQLAEEFKLEAWQVDNVLALIDEGNTIPFIARYRKEKTGSMSDEVLRDFSERLTYLRNLEAKKEQVMGTIEEQGKLTSELKEQIQKAATLVEVEDLYRPYRPKRRTRATIAKERGLEPLAMILWKQDDTTDMNTLAGAYVGGESDVATVDDALQGAKDIMAELVADEAEYRKQIRSLTAAKGQLTAKAKNPDATSVYEMYYDYREPVHKAAGHRILALNRGEAEKILSVSIEAPVEEILQYLERQIIRGEARRELLEEVIEDAYKRLIAPSIDNEIRGELTEKAQDGAIHVFGKNLTQLLM
ncbi:MAG: Tex-like N-terminal domain-containing protein, partial [Clostridia bacterium]